MNNTNNKKTAIYCRVALADETAAAGQEKRLREYAAEHDYTEVTV